MSSESRFGRFLSMGKQLAQKITRLKADNKKFTNVLMQPQQSALAPASDEQDEQIFNETVSVDTFSMAESFACFNLPAAEGDVNDDIESEESTHPTQLVGFFEPIAENEGASAVLPTPCNALVSQIFDTIGELEQTLIEDRKNDFRLRVALERETLRVHELTESLANEKKRNQRLLQLIRGDTDTSTDEEDSVSSRCLTNSSTRSRWQQYRSLDIVESVSPLLMQQRYDDLSISNRQCRRALVKKEKLLFQIRCEKEELQFKFDEMIEHYRDELRRCEEICCKYLRLRAKKNFEITRYRHSLNFANIAVLAAEHCLQSSDGKNAYDDFQRSSKLFFDSLKIFQWVEKSQNEETSLQL